MYMDAVHQLFASYFSQKKYPSATAYLEGFDDGYSGKPADPRFSGVNYRAWYNQGHTLGIEQDKSEFEKYMFPSDTLEDCNG